MTNHLRVSIFLKRSFWVLEIKNPMVFKAYLHPELIYCSLPILRNCACFTLILIVLSLFLTAYVACLMVAPLCMEEQWRQPWATALSGEISVRLVGLDAIYISD